jgi:DNA-binding MarR family transcriptional regulator
MRKAEVTVAPQSRGRAAKRPRPPGTSGTDKTGRRGARAAPPELTVESVGPPPPGEGKRGESGYLGYLLRQAQAASRLTLERALGELGVTVPQFVALTMLKAYPGISGAELARVALLTPQTVGVIIANLERDGAIQKTPDPVHGRRLQWTLTSRGLILLEQCRKHALALERRLAEGLMPKDERVIRQWLSRIAVSLQQDD